MVPYLVTAGVTVIILKPVFGERGMITHRDLILLPWIEMPRSTFWMGPDLGRRLPGFAVLSALSSAFGGLAIGRVMLVASLYFLGVGMVRLMCFALANSPEKSELEFSAERCGQVLGISLASVLSISLPVTLTRLSVGHLTTSWALAVTPYLLLTIGRDGPELAARSRASAMAALLGVVAGIYSVVLFVFALPFGNLNSWTTRIRRTLFSWFSRNAVWLLPGAFLQLHGFASFTNSEVFRPSLASTAEVLALLLGKGYWDPNAEALQGHVELLAFLAVVMVVLATIGWSRLPFSLRRPVIVGLGVGYGIPLIAVTPGIDDVFQAVLSSPFGMVLREPHRLVGLAVVPIVLLAALGSVEVFSAIPSQSRKVGRLIGFLSLGGISAVMLATSLPTVYSRLNPIEIPQSWFEARSLVSRDGGTVLALPWSEYVLLNLEREQIVYHPLADLFGLDSLVSSDPLMGSPVNEAADARSEFARQIATELTDQRFPSKGIRDLRIAWIAVLKVETAATLDLSRMAGIRKEISSESLDLYRVLQAPIPSNRPLPFVQIGGDGPTDIPWTWGWVDKEFRISGRTSEGLLRTRGTSVFVPALVGIALIVWTGYRAIRKERSLRRARKITS